MNGDKYCVICRAWLGNYITGETPEGHASYYSIIKRKYCPVCKPWKRSLDTRFNQAEYRKRLKKKRQETEKRIVLLTDENQLLKRMLADMRSELEYYKR